MKKCRCTYCGSTDYGKGCKYGPHGVHLHTEDATKCSYCGSKDYGKGCRINPTSNLHTRGAIYNNMYKESLQRILDEKILIEVLIKPFSEFECYKLGVIDENGNKIKQTITEQEQSSYDSLTKTIIKLKKLLGPKVDLIEATNSLKKKSLLENQSLEKYKLTLEYQTKIDSIINELHKTIDQAHQNGLSLSEIKNVILA